jgi:hypothetical protein
MSRLEQGNQAVLVISGRQHFPHKNQVFPDI